MSTVYKSYFLLGVSLTPKIRSNLPIHRWQWVSLILIDFDRVLIDDQRRQNGHYVGQPDKRTFRA